MMLQKDSLAQIEGGSSKRNHIIPFKNISYKQQFFRNPRSTINRPPDRISTKFHHHSTYKNMPNLTPPSESSKHHKLNLNSKQKPRLICTRRSRENTFKERTVHDSRVNRRDLYLHNFSMLNTKSHLHYNKLDQQHNTTQHSATQRIATQDFSSTFRQLSVNASLTFRCCVVDCSLAVRKLFVNYSFICSSTIRRFFVNFMSRVQIMNEKYENYMMLSNSRLPARPPARPLAHPPVRPSEFHFLSKIIKSSSDALDGPTSADRWGVIEVILNIFFQNHQL